MAYLHVLYLVIQKKFPLSPSHSFRYPWANGAERRSWRKPGARVLIPHCYLHQGKRKHQRSLKFTMIAGVGDQRWVVILTDLKNVADCHK
jgi:hypothetical protein